MITISPLERKGKYLHSFQFTSTAEAELREQLAQVRVCILAMCRLCPGTQVLTMAPGT